MLAFLLAPLRASKWAEQLGLGIRKSRKYHAFHGSRRVAEHTPGTLEGMPFLDFLISGTTCSAGAYSAVSVYDSEVSGIAGIPGGVSAEVL